jgi:hypothetical protein
MSAFIVHNVLPVFVKADGEALVGRAQWLARGDGASRRASGR